MKGYLKIKIGDIELYKPNTISTYEVSRAYRRIIEGSTPESISLYGDLFFRGDHTLDYLSGTFPQVGSYATAILNLTMPSLASTGEVFRYRRKVTDTNGSTAQPNQIGYAQGQACAQGTSMAPDGLMSLTDIGLKQIGNVFGHPEGRDAFFNETAVVPTGVGNVFSSGCLDFATGSSNGGESVSGSNTGEEGHYIYKAFIGKTGDINGNSADANYFVTRRPYFLGTFEPGSSNADAAPGAETLSDRLGTTVGRGVVDVRLLIPDSPSPTPSQLSYDADYPTSDGNSSAVTSICTGLVFDGLPAFSGSVAPRNKHSGKIWWITSDIVNNSHANASTNRAVWSWKRFTPESPVRRDASGSLGMPDVLNTFPTLSSSVQFRDLKAGRGGYIYLAADSDDDDESVGTDAGALIMIDSHSGTIPMVAGQAVGAEIYTSGGMQQNNVLAITVDKSGLHTERSDLDRVWSLHRNGLSYFDVYTDTGAISGSIQTVGSGTSDFNTIDGDSIRGLAGFLPRGQTSIRNNHGSLLDVDSNGHIYWASCETGKNYTNSLQRLNRMLGGNFAHSFWTMHNTAESGADGYIEIGASNNAPGVSGTINTLIVHRRDPGDPDSDDIWLATGEGDNQYNSKNVIQIATSSLLAENNPGIGYFGPTLTDSSTDVASNLHISPGGSAWYTETFNNHIAYLEPLGKVLSGTGTGDSFSTPVLSGSTWVQTLTDSASRFDDAHKGKRILIESSLPENSGSRIVSEVLDRNNIIVIGSGVAETSAFAWSFQGTEFDSSGTTGGSAGTWTDTNAPNCGGYNWFADDSGIGYVFYPRSTSAVGAHYLLHTNEVMYQFNDGTSQWYRSRAHHQDAASKRLVHSTSQHITNGVEIAFSATNLGGSEFVKDETYTFPVSIGLIKDATQEIEWGYDIFMQKTDLIVPPLSESRTNKPCSTITARGGMIGIGSLASVTTDDPFVLTESGSIQLATYQRRLGLDGNNGTIDLDLGNGGSLTTANGWQMALDFGVDIISSKLIFAHNAESTAFGANVEHNLYSATEAAGSGSWTLRSTWRSNEDHPAWLIMQDVFRENLQTSREIMINLEDLDGSGSFGSNTAARYWKLTANTFRSTESGQTTINPLGAIGFDAAGEPIGISTKNRLLTSHDTDYLANHVVRGVFLQNSGTGAQQGTVRNVVELAVGSGTFATGSIAQNDFFRVLSNGAEPKTILEEHRISSVINSGSLSLQTDFKLGLTSDHWEIVRDASIIPRDDEGGSEDQAQFPTAGPTGTGEVYICPVTGHITYNDKDVGEGRVFRVEKYVKVKREI